MNINSIITNQTASNPIFINVKQFNTQCKNICAPIKKNSANDHEQTDSSSYLNNQKCRSNISNMILLKPAIIDTCSNFKLNIVNENKIEKNKHMNLQETIDSHEDNCLHITLKTELLNFLTSPLDKYLWLRGKIISTKEKDTHILRYYIAPSDKAPEVLIMTAKKIKRKKYEIYAHDHGKNTTILIGKLSTNLLSNTFTLTSLITHGVIEKITYDLNLFGLTGPLKLKVQTDLKEKLNENKVFTNKMPNYSISKNDYNSYYIVYNCYILNYINRSIKSSVKNFQLIANINNNDTTDEQNIILQFGQISNCCFIIDFKLPFSPFQVFAIGISSIRNKRFCE